MTNELLDFYWFFFISIAIVFFLLNDFCVSDTNMRTFKIEHSVRDN